MHRVSGSTLCGVVDTDDHRYTPIPESELYSSVFSRIYDPASAVDQDAADSHRLAVLYLVFALGTLMDLDEPYLSMASTQYYQLLRMAYLLFKFRRELHCLEEFQLLV